MSLIIYQGLFDTSDDGKIINVIIGDDEIEFNIETVINAHNNVLLNIEPEDLKQIQK